MLNVPTLKFDKSIKYLESQISIQKNNKSLILDIISNIGLIINASSDDKTDVLQNVLDTANNFLQNISNNITTLEQLKIEILNTTSELNEIVSLQSKSTKSKEYYIAAFSNIKNNIIQYTQNLQEVENKLEQDNNAFNDFIKDNDFKYTFNTTNNEENTYELASFSINNDTTSISTNVEPQDISDDDIIDNGIEEANAKNEESIVEQEDVITEKTVIEQEEIITEAENATEELSSAENSVLEKNSTEFENIVEEQTCIAEPTNHSPADELADVFKELLFSLYDNKISEADFKAAIVDLKSHIPNYKNTEKAISQEDIITEPEVKVDNNLDVQEENIVEDTVEDVAEESIIEEITNKEEIAEIQENETILDTESSINDNYLIESLLVDESIELNEPEQSQDLEPEPEPVQDPITSLENQKKQVETRHQSIEDMIKKIESAEEKNKVLLISEKTNKIYLPYRITELQNYIKYYPKAYKSLSDVVNQEFILDLNNFSKHPGKARFTETYNLVRNRSGKSFFKALSYALKVTNNRKLDPAVIAACKSEYELHCYLYCLEQNKFDSFKFFTIVYDVNLF